MNENNTADQLGAMQPASSASSADLAALFKELSNCYVIRYGRKTTIELPYDLYDRILAATRNESAIVPQVVQAPIDLADIIRKKNTEIDALGIPMWTYATQDSRNARRYRRLQVLGAAPFGCDGLEHGTVLRFTNLDEFVDADITAHPSRGEAAPIVATVPSEQKPVAWVRLRSDGGYEGPLMDSSRDMCDIRRRSGAWTPLYAAPSPTEQASDVRNEALEEAAMICDNDQRINTFGEGDGFREPKDSAKAIRALKSATAAKGNAPDERNANNDLLTYVLQDDVHNRLTPRVIDIAYTAFMCAKQPNDEDGGASDWFTDTRPIVLKAIDKLRSDLAKDQA